MRQLSFIVTYKQALFKQEIRPQWQFTRAIRKAASSTLSAASQLIFAHKAALPLSFPTV